MRSTPLSFRLTLLLSLYVAEGLPSGLCTEALPALMRSYGLSATVIGYSGLLLLPWAVKFLWAPYVDAWYSSRLGQRRSWIVPTQLAAASLLFCIAFFDPQKLRSGVGLPLFFGLLLLVNFLAATHDIACDGLAVRALTFNERGLGNGIQVAGYRLGLIGGGGLLLYVIGAWGWHTSFLVLSVGVLVLLLPALLFREPPTVAVASAERLPYRQIFRSFFARPGMRGWFIALLICKAGESLGSAMVKPMFVDLGYSLQKIGLMVSVIGSASTLAGALLGGYLTSHIGRVRAIILFYSLQALAMLGYGALAWWHGHGQPLPDGLVYAVNALEHAASGMATAAMLTVVMDCCRQEHAGADFTVQVSLMTVGGGSLYLFSGLAKDALGYPLFFLLAATVAMALLGPVAYYCRRLPCESPVALAGITLLRENAGP